MNGRPTVPVPKGYRVGPWEVRELLASGAFGSVYAARLAGDGGVASGRPAGDGGKASGRPAGTGEAGERSAEAADGPAEAGERSPEIGERSAEAGDRSAGTPDRHPAADEKPAEEAAGDHGTGPLPRRAALKFLPTGTRTPRQLHHLRELAHREQELLSRLRSPRLIRMYDALTVDDPDHPELDGATVLVLERAEGSLATLLDRSPHPPHGPALLAQVCEGLNQLHHAGWVHGDLKPANVLLMKDGSARLGDFNMAAEMEGTHAYAPAFATPDYTAPELLWSEVSERGTQIRPTADIWSFGVLAHLVLTGTFPLPGGTTEARCDAAVRYARGTEELRLSPELPTTWREIITDCLARTHEERALHDAASLLRRVERAAGTSRSARLPRLRPRRRWRPALVGALAAAALIVATTVVYATREDDQGLAYGYHRCPADSVCFFSEPNGSGEMCSWDEDDTDWLSGPDTCEWTGDQPVKSIFNNSSDDENGLGAVAYFRGRDFTPVGADVTRENARNRTGCTSQRNQGNLAGTYAPLSHRWIARC
ncbi:protein kinase domain-containing protein [Streptomyces phaeochromogenes]|uniref:protein kinase domain-containing protein n=1 Tax=Streptomyces phaeochromogenes TaxID=1923 RepID=UPI0038660E2C|nr:protein kinase [Streptomyces phaeochromogenes]